MKTIKILVVLLLMVVSVQAQEKRLNFIHGMGDDGEVWDYADSLAARYNVERRTPTYETFEGINTAVDSLNSMITINNANREIIIAQSLGGLVAKQMLRNNRNAYGGLITIGTPHLGAKAANVLNNGGLDRLADLASNKLIAGPNQSVGAIPFYGDLIEAIRFVAEVLNIISFDLLCKWLEAVGVSKDILDIVFHRGAVKVVAKLIKDSFNKYYEKQSSETLNDLAEGSQIIRDLDDYAKANMRPWELPTVAIWGNEKSPATLRMVGSSREIGDEEAPVRIVSVFGDLYHDLATLHYAKATIQAAIVAGLSWWHWYNPWVWYTAYRSYRNFRAAPLYREGGHFLKKDLITDMNYLIGAYRTEKRSYTNWEYKCVEWKGKNLEMPDELNEIEGDMWNNNYEAENAGYHNDIGSVCTRYEWKRVTHYYTQYIREGSDGLLHKTTQTALPGATVFPADEVNHLEETSHPEVRRILIDIFDGGTDAGDFFDLTEQ